MSHRTRAAKVSALSLISPSKSKKSTTSTKKNTRKIIEKKTSPIQTRQKRLSSLTAATLLQYCTSLLSPSRKCNPTSPNSSNHSKNKPTKKTKVVSARKRRLSNVSSKSENKPTINEPEILPRTRREASSRASAMIMQQNEIERSRLNYSISNDQSNSRRNLTKNILKNKNDLTNEQPSIESFQFNIPQVPPLITTSPIEPTESISSTNTKYPTLTEALLSEHTRLYEAMPSYHTSKRDYLIKWTQETNLYTHSSSPLSDSNHSDLISTNNQSGNTSSQANIQELPINTTNKFNTITHPTTMTPNFLFPSSSYPLDLHSFYPLLPCWQYPAWPSIVKRSCPSNSIEHFSKTKQDLLTLHLHTHHHHHHIKNSNSFKSINTIVETKEENKQISKTFENHVLNLSINKQNDLIKRTNRKKSSPIKRQTINRTKSNQNEKVNNENKNKPIRRITLKRRTQSATVLTKEKDTKRTKRTNSASVLLSQNRKRSISPTLTNKILNQRKKLKSSRHWILFGKSEQKLVTIRPDEPAVFRECFPSIQHVMEKDIIKSDDCIIVRSDTGTRDGSTPFVAKVKWFWEEESTGEIQMSLIWFYHVDHTELPLHVKQRFLSNELLASKYSDCISVECIEDKCYVLNLNEYNRYCLREQTPNLFEHSESIGQIKCLLNKNISTIQHRPLPPKTVGNQNVFFCRYVYDYRVKRILKNPNFNNSTTTSTTMLNT